MATSSYSHPGTSSFGASMGMSTPSYGMAGINSGNTGMGSGMTGYTGMSSMNTGMTGLSTSGMNSGMGGLSTSGMNSGMGGLSTSGTNSGMTGLSSINPTMSGSFGMNPVGSSPRYPSAGSSAGNQTRSASGSTALDSLFAPELGHLQNKSKPSMNAMQSQQAGMQTGTPGMNPGTFCHSEEWIGDDLSLRIECNSEVTLEFCLNSCSPKCSLKTFNCKKSLHSL